MQDLSLGVRLDQGTAKAIISFGFFLVFWGLCKPAQANPKFKIIQESYRGKVFDVRIPEGDEELDLTKTFPDEVLLGIESGHMDVIVGKHQLEGAFLPIPSWRESRKKSKPGILIRFPSLSKEKVIEIEKQISSEFSLRGFSLSCVSDACANLKNRANIQVKNSANPIFLSTTFKHILENGFVDENGKAIPFEIYKTQANEFSLEGRATALAVWDVLYTGVSIGATVGTIVPVKAMGGDALGYLKPKCSAHFSRIRKSWNAYRRLHSPATQPQIERFLNLPQIIEEEAK